MSTTARFLPALRLPFFLRSEPVEPALQAALDEADVRAFRLITRVKFVALGLVLVYVLVTLPTEVTVWPITGIFLVMASGAALYRLECSSRRASWHRYAFLSLDIIVVTLAVLVPNPGFNAAGWAPQIAYRFNSSLYLFIFIALAALTYSPRFVLWVGCFSALSWGVGAAIMLMLPSSRSVLDLPSLSAATDAERLALLLDPHHVPISNITQSMTLLVIVALIVSVAVWRTRRLISRQLGAERERANLSRYFSPSMVEELARTDEPLGKVRAQDVAVLFADIKGFTGIAETASPEATIEMLREFHRRMATAVFAHKGTLDKYMGDGLMATFGTPRVTPDDAVNAIRCARAMTETIADWNRERAGRGEARIEMGVGVHFGPVVLGDIGDERRLEFAVIGDTVNTASRVEHLTREHGIDAAVSGAAVTAAGARDAALIGSLRRIGDSSVRGRDAAVTLYTFA
ncbi:MAG: adenylate/guanylate cyclase domain-containing protein [Bauldia litoralis]